MAPNYLLQQALPEYRQSASYNTLSIQSLLELAVFVLFLLDIQEKRSHSISPINIAKRLIDKID